ncbi:MAG: DNA polymerase III subunit beta [Eubacteriales bacterium]|jgi:DNA polymerase-3 subunit beta
MQFTCDRDLLMDSINVVQKAVTSKSTLPALEGILLQTMDEGRLKLTGYDLEIGIESVLEADIQQPGSIVINSKMLGDIVRKMPSDSVTVTVDANLMTRIQCGRIDFNIIGLESAEYPELPRVEGEKSFSLSQSVLKSMIRQTLFAVSTNDNKPVHTGCLFEISDGELRVVSVDGYRLALRREPLQQVEDMSFVVPGKTLGEILKILSDDEEAQVQVVLTKRHIVFEIDQVTVVSRLLEGDFLNYNNAIPKNNKIFATVDVRGFTSCVERAALIINDKMKSPVRVKIQDQTLRVQCMSTIGKVQDELDIQSEGGEIEIGFNHRYLLDALKACEEEQVRLELSSPLSPCVMTPCEGDKYLFLVLPVRLKANEN